MLPLQIQAYTMRWDTPEEEKDPSTFGESWKKHDGKAELFHLDPTTVLEIVLQVFTGRS